jgi:hypothetical protein
MAQVEHAGNNISPRGLKNAGRARKRVRDEMKNAGLD